MKDYLINNLWLVVVALVSGGMLLRQGFRGGNELSPTEAVQLMNRDALVLDVREDVEFAHGHIADARHIPLAQLEGRVGELHDWKEKAVVVNCQSGMRSAKACAVLKRLGFTQVYNLAGGLAAWQGAKLPVTKD